MERAHILSEIRRVAVNGKALGAQAFATETGIREHDWRGKHWARWGDALIEAGYTPNQWKGRIDDSFILGSMIALTRKLGRFPTVAEMAFKRRKFM